MAITPHQFQLVGFCLHRKAHYKSCRCLTAITYSYMKIYCLILNTQRKFWQSRTKYYVNRHRGEGLGQSVICSYRTMNKSQLLDCCIMMNITFHWITGNWFNSLMTTMEILLRKLVCLLFNLQTQCELVLSQWHCCCWWWLYYTNNSRSSKTEQFYWILTLIHHIWLSCIPCLKQK
jgi:hypothetical protein